MLAMPNQIENCRDFPACQLVFETPNIHNPKREKFMPLGKKVLIVVGCVVPAMLVFGGLAVAFIKTPSGPLWEKVPQIAVIMKAGMGVIFGGSLGFGAAKLYINMNSDDFYY